MRIVVRFSLEILEDIVITIVFLIIKDFLSLIIFLIFIRNVCPNFITKVAIFESFIIRISFNNVLLRSRTLLVLRIERVCEF